VSWHERQKIVSPKIVVINRTKEISCLKILEGEHFIMFSLIGKKKKPIKENIVKKKNQLYLVLIEMNSILQYGTHYS